MLRRTDRTPGTFAALVVVAAIVLLMVPTCVMIGCTMSGSAMFVPFGNELSMSAPCGGTYVLSKAPVGTIPTNVDASIVAVIAALIVAFVLVVPRLEAAAVRSARDGPPRPLEPLDDVKLRI